jgi:lipoate-protein ligase A
MLLFNLGHLPGQQSMLVFHALARMGAQGLVIVSPKSPLVSIGYFQDADREVDLDYCRRSAIPFMRREVGGGATYLDGNQVFYQLIWNKDSTRFPSGIREIYRWFSTAPVETYREFGVKALYRSVNDIVTEEGRKIAGEGGGNIGPSMVFVGGILLDFDCETMSRVLKVPDEKLRDKVHKTMRENLTTMKGELGAAPPREEVARVLIEKFEKLVGELEPAELTPAVVEKMTELEARMTSERFLHLKRARALEGVKIREGVQVHYGIHKAPGGLIRTAEEIRKDTIEGIVVSGDFTFFPKEKLESMQEHLAGAKADDAGVVERVERFYEKEKVESPGVAPEDIKEAILKPLR